MFRHSWRSRGSIFRMCEWKKKHSKIKFSKNVNKTRRCYGTLCLFMRGWLQIVQFLDKKGINFRDFAIFFGDHESLYPGNLIFSVTQESLYLQNHTLELICEILIKNTEKLSKLAWKCENLAIIISINFHKFQVNFHTHFTPLTSISLRRKLRSDFQKIQDERLEWKEKYLELCNNQNTPPQLLQSSRDRKVIFYRCFYTSFLWLNYVLFEFLMKTNLRT